jgi:hypothetical protein
MTRTRWIWLGSGLLYLLFFSWYTSFGGPLTDKEINEYLAHFDQRGIAAEQRRMLEQFMRTDTGDDFVMLNVIDMYETPLQVAGVQPGDSSADVLDKYMEYMYPALFARASHPVMFGNSASIAMDLMNAPAMDHWTQGAMMRYRSRRDFLDITANPAFSGSHDFKVAALRKTIAFPLDPWTQLGDPRLVLALLLGLLAMILGWREALRGVSNTVSNSA